MRPGDLPPEVIRKVVRDNYGAFRACYEQGLKQDASLAGSVVVSFVIEEDGRVSNAALNDSTTLTDRAVIDCVLQHYAALQFPKPEGGFVNVVYPIRFMPEEPSSQQ